MRKGQTISRLSLEEKFWQHATPTDGCWMWKGKVNKAGYGSLYHKGQLVASRVSYLLHHGFFDVSLLVCHRCDVPGCVNPDHLFLGTALDNHRDMVSKGRRNNHTNTDLTNLQSHIEKLKIKCKITKGPKPGIYNSLTEAAIANGTNTSWLGKLLKGTKHSPTIEVEIYSTS